MSYATPTGVLVYAITQDTLVVHAPPEGFNPPPPDTWATMVGLVAACGSPATPSSGYGERWIVEQAVRRGEVKAVWCPLCYPRG